MGRVRYGICILPEHPWARAAGRWRRAEEYGFDHAWTYDHLVWGGLPDAPWHSTVATLTAAATVTERIRLGTFVASPNFRHPVTFMRDVLTLDDVSSGRLLLGLGAGGDLDAGILGERLSRRQRSDRFAEFTGLLDRLLTEDHVDHDGEYYTAVDARTLPGCVQRPRAPFVIAANGPRALRLAVRHGQGWVTTGRAPGTEPAAPGTRRDAGYAEAWWRGTGELVTRYEQVLAAAVETGERTEREAPRRYLSLDSTGTPALSSLGFFEEQVGRAAELGFTDVVVHWPRAEDPYRAPEQVLEEVADRFLAGRATVEA